MDESSPNLEGGGRAKFFFEKYWFSLLLNSSWPDTCMVCRLRAGQQKYRVWIRVRGRSFPLQNPRTVARPKNGEPGRMCAGGKPVGT